MANVLARRAMVHPEQNDPFQAPVGRTSLSRHTLYLVSRVLSLVGSGAHRDQIAKRCPQPQYRPWARVAHDRADVEPSSRSDCARRATVCGRECPMHDAIRRQVREDGTIARELLEALRRYVILAAPVGASFSLSARVH